VRWGLALAIGVAALAGVLGMMIDSAQTRSRVFHAHFPIDLSRALLGRNTVAATLLVPLLALGAWELRRRPAVVRAVVAIAAVVIVTWLAAPRDLLPRFFIWLVPAVGVLVAAAVARHRWATVLAAGAVVAGVVHFAPTLTESSLANREAAALADRLTGRGLSVCTVGQSNFALEVYTHRVRAVATAELGSCDAVVQVFTPVPDEVAAAPRLAPGFPFRRVLPARYPGVISSRAPLLAGSP
jgi:hypothetical protein